MLKAIILSLLAITTVLAFATEEVIPSQQSEIKLVRSYLQARLRTMQEHATAADVDMALAFCTDDVVYEHPAVNAKTEGKDNLKKGMTGYLGETKDASFQLGRVLANKNVVMAEVSMKFLMKQEDGTWERGGRKNITVFELVKGKIKRILDY
jgi:ketosteroid isomerase-like protein